MMPAQLLKGLDELVLATLVARRFYIDGRTKIETSDEFRVSRFKIARLLDAAREQGLVRIEINYPGAIDVELSAQLRDTFNLKHAIVLDAQEEDAAELRGRCSVVMSPSVRTPQHTSPRPPPTPRH